MTSNRALVEELIRRMNARDMRVADVCHRDVEWHWAESTPGASLYRGHDEVHEGLRTWAESWEELVIEPQEVLEEDDYVFVMTEYRMRGAGSGVPLEAPVAHLHQFEDGLLRRWWMFGDAEKARRRFVAGDRPG